MSALRREVLPVFGPDDRDQRARDRQRHFVIALGIGAGAVGPDEHADTVKVLKEQDVKDRLNQLGMAPVGNTPAEFAKEIAVEFERWGKVVSARKLTAN